VEAIFVTQFFKNPIMVNGADPWVYRHSDGNYYFMVSLQERLDLWSSKSLSAIAQGTRHTIWVPKADGPCSKNIWAPEIHFIGGKWYVYFTANDGGGDETRRIYVLENQSPDPLEKIWVEKGAINTQYAGLDGTVLQHNGELYFLYAGYGNFPDYGSAIYIAQMTNPWTLKGANILLTKPEYDWEKQGGMAINEGPAILKRNGRIFLVYSASTTWTEDYCLGMLTASELSDLMTPMSWLKSNKSVFKKSVENKAVAPGHNSFTKSPDGKEDWIVYHAISGTSGEKLNLDFRSTRAQKFEWNADGAPNFGEPASCTVAINVPSGEE
jgi:GH43 family beta-xylosidase